MFVMFDNTLMRADNFRGSTCIVDHRSPRRLDVQQPESLASIPRRKSQREIFSSTKHLLNLKLLRRCLIEWFVALAMWFGFAFSLSNAELLVGATCAVLTVVTLEVVFRAEPLCFEPSWRMLAEVRRVPLLIIKGLGALLSVLAARIQGGRSQSAFRVIAFRPGGSSAQQAARRVLVVSFSTTPPNSIVVGIDREKQQMLLHQVKRRPLPGIIRHLEASE